MASRHKRYSTRKIADTNLMMLAALAALLVGMFAVYLSNGATLLK